MLMVTLTMARAGDVFTYTLSGGKAESKPAGFFTYDTSGKFSFNTKFTGCEYNGVTYSNGLKMEGSTKIMFTTNVESIVTIVQSNWSSHTIKLDDVELAVADAEEITGGRVYTIEGVAAGAHTVTRGSGESGLFLVKVEYTADDPTPVLTIAPKEVTLNASPLARTRNAVFSLTGKNLTDGTYSLAVPEVEGLSVSPESFSVAEGVVNQEFQVSYTSETDVPASTAVIGATVGDLEASLTVKYQSRAAAYEQTTVSEDKSWDWETLAETVTLSENTIPSINDDFVFRELEDQINFGTFDAQSIIISKTQYPVRSKKFQNGTIKFITDRPGVITVDFSDTGSSGDNPAKRFLNVNGTNTEFFTQRGDGSSDRKVSGEIAVPAGEVAITGMGEDGTTSQALCIYKVTYKPTGEAVHYEAYLDYDMSRLPNWSFPQYVLLGEQISVPYTISSYADNLTNAAVTLYVNGEAKEKTEIGTIVTDEEMGEGNYTGIFTFTPEAVGDIEIKLELDFTGAALDVNGQHVTDPVVIAVTNEKPAATEVPDIASLKQSQDDGEVALTLTDVKVTYVGKTTEFDYDTFDYVETDVVVMEDATGGIMLRGSGLGNYVTAGQTLNGTLGLDIVMAWGEVTGTLTNGIEGVQATDGEVTPLVLTDENVLDWAATYSWRLVTINNATIEMETGTYGNDFYLKSDLLGERYGIMDALGIITEEPTAGDVVNATGYIYNYLGMMDLFQPISLEKVATGINGVKAAESTAPVYNLNGVRVNKVQKGLYIQNGKKLFVK